MGPKEYRICWLGHRENRMLSIFKEENNRFGECSFLAYPGSEKQQLKDICPSFLIINTENLDGHKKSLLRWISTFREITSHGKILILAKNGSSRYFSDALLTGADWVLPITDNDISLRFCLQSMILQHKTEKHIARNQHEASQCHLFEGMIGKSDIMKDLSRIIWKCSPSHANILIRGESGTGKELVAQSIHRLSGRKGKLVNINCAALMDNLHQSDLFGHERGAFTDAKARRLGYFEAAEGGTLFLDEIGDISPITQIALLRVIEGKEFFRVGGCESINVDVRVVSATNQNLEEKVKKGQFREDLYYRLNGFSITVPPLRSRKEDIPLLAEYFLKEASKKDGKQVMGFTQETMDLLTCYNWPGNVRELENEIQRIVIRLEGERMVSSDMLSQTIDILQKYVPYNFLAQSSLKMQMQQLEAICIKEALKKNYENRTRTAQYLGISREGLHKKMARYKIY